MPGDGVSLPTTLAQMGSVAKTQARGQQSSPQVTPFSEQKADREELRIQRVKETSKTEKSRVTRQDEDKDKRKRRRLKRVRKKEQEEQQEMDEGTVGSLIDLRV
ncbi:MAG: hypothetical protein KAH56_12305 [Candidatus Krumholzibacteria bacterium]|nr:hypothetical protein [Candidatus Krumholzibacteria bacterium]